MKNTVNDVWRYVAVGEPDACWEWQACRDHKGYGGIRIAMRQMRAHRAAFMAATGTDPGELCVLHRCDNPPCCNPAHLFLGTRADNNRDCQTKGRTLRGSRHPQAKLTEAQVREIRERRQNGEQGIALAKAFGVTPTMISYIHRRDNWAHV